jgi:hypothetical protein
LVGIEARHANKRVIVAGFMTLLLLLLLLLLLHRAHWLPVSDRRELLP